MGVGFESVIVIFEELWFLILRRGLSREKIKKRPRSQKSLTLILSLKSAPDLKGQKITIGSLVDQEKDEREKAKAHLDQKIAPLSSKSVHENKSLTNSKK